MRGYYITNVELNVTEQRIKLLQDKKKMLFDKITSATSQMKESPSKLSYINDQIANYLVSIETIDKEVSELQDELNILQSHLNKMNCILQEIRTNHKNDIKTKIFIMRYVDGLKPQQIAMRIPCHLATVYRKLQEITIENY